MRLFLSLVSVLFLTNLLGQGTDSDFIIQLTNGNNEPVAFANAQLKKTDVGQVYNATSNATGVISFKSIPSGGPYELSVSSVGYQEHRSKLFLKLGENSKSITMAQGINLKQVVVESASKTALEGENMSAALLNKAPSIKHRIQDAVQRVPTVFQNSFNGHNYRYNDLRIDGVGMNDMIGFQEPASGSGGSVASSTPGALAQTQPISMEAIEQLQVLQSSTDVRVGSSTAGTINAITKSGTNTTKGMVYGNLRNYLITGNRPNGENIDIPEFEEYRLGANLGGALIKDKLFYFANIEQQKNTTPLQNAPGDPGVGIPVDVAQQIADTLKSKYNFDPGTFGKAVNVANSVKTLVRLDYYKNSSSRFNLRYNFVSAFADNLERGQNILRYASQGYRHNSTTNSLAGEWNKTFANGAKNKLSIGYNRVDENRSYDTDVFPHIEIDYNTSNTILAGTYREASVYGSLVNSYHFQNDYSYTRGNHEFVVGTRNEMHDLNYFFLTAWNGRWEYSSLQNFLDDKPNRIRGVYSYGPNDFNSVRTTPSASFDYLALSAYIQDNWRINNKLSLTSGIRFDAQNHLGDIPVFEKVANNSAFDRFNNKLSEKIQVNPRAHLKYKNRGYEIDVSAGMFSGRVPLAWYAYPHYISGNNYGNIDVKPNGAVVPITDVENLVGTDNQLTEINLLAEDFKQPRYLKTQFKIEKSIKQSTFNLNVLYDKAIREIWFRSLNLVDSTSNLNGPDNRAYYALSGSDKKIESDFTNVFGLDNTNKGYKLAISVGWEQKFSNQLRAGASYTYGSSKDVSNGVRNSMAANYNRNQIVDGRVDDLSFSNFDLRHKFLAHATYVKPWNNNNITTVYSFANVRSGSPFSFVYSGDVNSDGSSRNDLFFVPAKQDDIVLVDVTDAQGNVVLSADEQWSRLNDFIESVDYLKENRGKYTQRNGGRTPWNKSVDLRINHNLSLKSGNRIQFQLDVFNVLNLLNSNWGVQHFVSNSSNASFSTLSYVGRDAEERPNYVYKHDGSSPWQVDNFASRWQMQMGIKYFFNAKGGEKN